MIRIDVQKCDFSRMKDYVYGADGKTPAKLYSFNFDYPAKVEILIDDNEEGSAFQEILEELKIPILKKRVF